MWRPLGHAVNVVIIYIHGNQSRRVRFHNLLCSLVADPYVKVSLMCHGRRVKKKKTQVKKATLNPVYNEAIVFDVPGDSIDDVSLLINVIDYDRYWLRRSHSPTSNCCRYAFVTVCVLVRSCMYLYLYVRSFVRCLITHTHTHESCPTFYIMTPSQWRIQSRNQVFFSPKVTQFRGW